MRRLEAGARRRCHERHESVGGGPAEQRASSRSGCRRSSSRTAVARRPRRAAERRCAGAARRARPSTRSGRRGRTGRSRACGRRRAACPSALNSEKYGSEPQPMNTSAVGEQLHVALAARRQRRGCMYWATSAAGRGRGSTATQHAARLAVDLRHGAVVEDADRAVGPGAWRRAGRPVPRRGASLTRSAAADARAHAAAARVQFVQRPRVARRDQRACRRRAGRSS